MVNVIIGVHGLSNKPAAAVLQEEWRLAIMEGQQNIGNEGQDFEFIMVYWADLLYLSPEEKGEYAPAAPGTIVSGPDDSWWAWVVDASLRAVGGLWDVWNRLGGGDAVTQRIIAAHFRDLDLYYKGNLENGEKAKNALRERLAPLLRAQDANSVTLIGHSMGSIIAYDCLLDLESEGITVDNFVTIGSPLGLPTVKHEIEKERGHIPPLPPRNVTGEWHNFSDRQDLVTVDHALADDFGNPPVIDHRVRNTFVDGHGKANPHKSFGYLRGPEFSRHLRSCMTPHA